MEQKAKQTETLLVIVLGLATIYWFKRTNGILLAALLTGAVGLLIPAAAKGIHWFWTRLSQIMGLISGKILLTTVYVLVLIPLSFLARRLGKLSVKRKPSGDTLFIERNHTYTKEDITHPW